MNVEPTLADLCKRALDDLLKSADPALLSGVELNLCNT